MNDHDALFEDCLARLESLSGVESDMRWARGRILADAEQAIGRGMGALYTLASTQRIGVKRGQLRQEHRVARAWPDQPVSLPWSYYRAVTALAVRDGGAQRDDAVAALEKASDHGWTVEEFSTWIKGAYGRDARGRSEVEVPAPDLIEQDVYTYVKAELGARCPWLRGGRLEDAASAALDAVLVWQEERKVAA